MNSLSEYSNVAVINGPDVLSLHKIAMKLICLTGKVDIHQI